MVLRSVLLFSVLGLAAGFGCYGGPRVDVNRAPTPAEPTEEADPTDPTTPPTTPAASGLPCDVANLMASECTSCHGDKLANDAPNRLVTYDDLAAPSESNPAKTVAALSLDRMKSAKRPMPPSGQLDADRIAVLEKWVGAGLPKGSCSQGAPADAGAAATRDSGTSTGTRDAGSTPPPPPAVATCTTGTPWTPAAGNDAFMRSGEACLGCHGGTTAAKTFFMMGTVFASKQEPDDCSGVSGVTVYVTDANGVVHTMTTNAAGNFTRVTPFAVPYTAKIVVNGQTREMTSAQMSGDCNGCHTDTAPQGRIR